MTTDKETAERIRNRARAAQRKGDAGAAMKLQILASEAKTIRDLPGRNDGA